MTSEKNMYIRSTGGSLVAIPVSGSNPTYGQSGSGKSAQPVKDVKNKVSKKARTGQR